MAESNDQFVDKASLALVAKEIEESLQSDQDPPKTFGETESKFVDSVLNQSVKDQQFYRNFMKYPSDIVNRLFFTSSPSKSDETSSVASTEPERDSTGSSSKLSGWCQLRHVTLLHQDAGQLSTLNPDVKVYIDHVKDGKAYISQPKVGWVSEGNVVQVTQKDTGSFFQRVMQKISQSIHKDEKQIYRVVGEQGVIVRKERELSSDAVGHLPLNTMITVSAIRGRRAHITHPIEGWCSIKSGRGTLFLELSGKSEIEQNQFLMEILRHKIQVAGKTNTLLEENMGDTEINDMLEHMQFSKTLIRNEEADKRKELVENLKILRIEVEKRQKAIQVLFQKIENLRVNIDDSK